MKTPFPAKALGLTLLTIACLSVTACQKGSTTGADAPPPEVGVMTIQPQTLTITTELPGRTSPYLISEVRPQVSGILLNRQFEEGSQVRAGQVLYQIDPAPYQAALNRAEASLSSAKLQAERYEKLIAVHAVSQQQYDDARSQYLQAKATTDASRIDLGYTRITAPIPAGSDVRRSLKGPWSPPVRRPPWRPSNNSIPSTSISSSPPCPSCSSRTT